MHFFACVNFVCSTCTKTLVQFINRVALSCCKARQGRQSHASPHAPLPPEHKHTPSDLPYTRNPTITKPCTHKGEKFRLLGKNKSKAPLGFTSRGDAGAGAAASEQHRPDTRTSSAPARGVRHSSGSSPVPCSATAARGSPRHPRPCLAGRSGGDAPHCPSCPHQLLQTRQAQRLNAWLLNDGDPRKQLP